MHRTYWDEEGEFRPLRGGVNSLPYMPLPCADFRPECYAERTLEGQRRVFFRIPLIIATIMAATRR